MASRGSRLVLSLLVPLIPIIATNVNASVEPAATTAVSPLAGVWKETWPSGLDLTLIIADDGSLRAELWIQPWYDGTEHVVYQFIADGLPHLWPGTMWPGDMTEPVVLRMTPHKLLVDKGQITVEPYVQSFGGGDIHVAGGGTLHDANTMTLQGVYDTVLHFTRQPAMPAVAPYFDWTVATGTLQPGQHGTIDLICTTGDLFSTVTSIVADLRNFGGDAAVPLIRQANGTWQALLVPVLPSSAGQARVEFTATNAAGAVGTISTRLMIGQASQSMLEGCWDSEDGMQSIVIDAAGNAVSYFVMLEDSYFEVPCDGLPHPGFEDKQPSITPHTFNLDPAGYVKGSSFTFQRVPHDEPVSFTATGFLRSESHISLKFQGGWSAWYLPRSGNHRKVAMPPNRRPWVRDVQISSALRVNVSCPLTISCEVEALGAAVTEVTADLSSLGLLEPQSLAPDDTGRWTWTGAATPPVSLHGHYIAVQALDADGARGSSRYMYVSVANPTLMQNVRTEDWLGIDQPRPLTVSCWIDAPPEMVASVMLDLSNLGVAEPQPLSPDGEGNWTWTGTVTPPVPGEVSLTLTATDDLGNTGTAEVKTYVHGGAEPWYATIDGTLIKDVTSEITVSCQVVVMSRPAARVTADLSAIGGPAEVELTKAGAVHAWRGQVTPFQEGYVSPSVTVIDDAGGTYSVPMGIYVQDKVRIENVVATRRMVLYQEQLFRLSCKVTGMDAAISQVQVYLPDGHGMLQPVPDADGMVSIEVPLTVTSTDSVGVTIMAIDANGQWAEVKRRVYAATMVPGDASVDWTVDVTDLLTLAENWGLGQNDIGFNPLCDFNDDGAVDVVDLLILAENWPHD